MQTLRREEIMHRITSRFVLIVTVGIFMAVNVFAQEEPSTASPHLQPNAEPEEAAVRGVVDAIV